MIVEDHEWMRKQIRALVARPHVNVLECATGVHAIGSAHEFRPDWVITDLNLPGANGFEVTESVRKTVPAARVVIISAEDRKYLSEEARAVGAECFLSKHCLAELPEILYGDPNGAGKP